MVRKSVYRSHDSPLIYVEKGRTSLHDYSQVGRVDISEPLENQKCILEEDLSDSGG